MTAGPLQRFSPTKEASAMSETEGTRPVVTLELRGRDLALTPPAAWWSRDDDDLFAGLFGQSEASGAALLLRRDLRGRCLRARPLDFARLRDALAAHDAVAVHIGFEQHPLLSGQPEPRIAPRPYQEEALTAWRAAGCRGVVVLPTGAGKTIVGALALADMRPCTLVVAPTIDLLH